MYSMMHKTVKTLAFLSLLPFFAVILLAWYLFMPFGVLMMLATCGECGEFLEEFHRVYVSIPREFFSCVVDDFIIS